MSPHGGKEQLPPKCLVGVVGECDGLSIGIYALKAKGDESSMQSLGGRPRLRSLLGDRANWEDLMAFALPIDAGRPED